MRRAFALLAILMLGAAQREPQLPRMDGETVEVSLVNLDVVVTDKSGKRVHGLTADDFEVLEDGKPQAITNFSAFGAVEDEGPRAVRPADATESQPREQAPPEAQRRTIIIFVDQLRLKSFDRDPVFASIKKLLHEVVRKGDAVSILSWRGEPVSELDPTDDLAAADAALDAIAERVTGVVGDPLNDLRRTVTENLAFYERSVEAAKVRGYNVDLNSFVPPLDAYEAAVWQRAEVKRKAQTLTALMTGFAGTEGRKVLLVASHRLPQTAGAEFFFAAGQGWPLDAKLRSEFNMTDVVRAIARSANATGFTIYTLYPEGMGTTFTLPDAAQQNIHLIAPSGVTGGASAVFDNDIYTNEAISLHDIAEQTGGAMAGSAKDIVNLLPSVADDFSDYYSLAYRATRRGEDRSRDVVVRAKNRGYNVRSRRAIVEKSERTRMQERVVATLFEEPRRSAIPLKVQIGKAKKAGLNRYRIPLRIHIPVKQLMTVAEQRGAIGGFSVYLAWGGVLGEISDVTTRIQPFTGRDLRSSKGEFTYDFELMADDRTDRIAVGVLDELGKDFGVARVELPPRG